MLDVFLFALVIGLGFFAGRALVAATVYALAFLAGLALVLVELKVLSRRERGSRAAND